jgi:hypothetical protein
MISRRGRRPETAFEEMTAASQKSSAGPQDYLPECDFAGVCKIAGSTTSWCHSVECWTMSPRGRIAPQMHGPELDAVQ